MVLFVLYSIAALLAILLVALLLLACGIVCFERQGGGGEKEVCGKHQGTAVAAGKKKASKKVQGLSTESQEPSSGSHLMKPEEDGWSMASNGSETESSVSLTFENTRATLGA